MASLLPRPRSADPIWRYERKFEAHGLSRAKVETILRVHPACFRVEYPARHVNNLYLDQPDLRSFHLHVGGAPVRQKFRIRWYGKARGAVTQPILEIKHKRGLAGSKTLYALAPFTYETGFDFEPVRRDALARVREAEVAEFVAGAEPTLFNRYHRAYLRSGDGRFRITIDRDLRYERVQRGALGPNAEGYDDARAVVLELKYAVAHEPAAAWIAGRLPFRLGKYSKYIAGITRISGLSE